ncbi:hypothetical protein C4D60_Mb10t11270 [Musa balbisiana]|uniref:Uncharacterized protein n=1 Tax=Musa balbisiana TaxID=52838 RepID=A0A4S8IW94_MUSBA|nr:hypothetical protein C4D60_Mb10t11270 [Musa balbisiana]
MVTETGAQSLGLEKARERWIEEVSQGSVSLAEGRPLVSTKSNNIVQGFHVLLGEYIYILSQNNFVTYLF